MKIGDALRNVAVLYVETAPFIYYTENRVGFVDKMTEVFGYINRGQIRAITAALTLTESLMKPIQTNDTMLVNQFRVMYYNTQGITTLSITPKIADKAAVLRAHYNLKTPDALHLATAIDSGCDAFLSNDLTLKRVKEIPILILNEMDLSPSK